MIFYRHPTPDAIAGLCYGRLDLGVSKVGQDEVARACAAPPAIRHIISSPAKRARALAEPLAAATGATLAIDEKLWEMDFGAWEGRLWSEIDRQESDPWAEDVFTRAPPGGETFAALAARVQKVLTDLDDDACIITHAGPIRAARMILQGASFKDVFAAPVPFATPILLKGKTV